MCSLVLQHVHVCSCRFELVFFSSTLAASSLLLLAPSYPTQLVLISTSTTVTENQWALAMSGLEVVGCIAAVVSAFHGGAELVKAIKKKHKKRKDVERDFQEKQLQESLEQGEKQVSVRYCAEYDVFGYAFRAGDGMPVLAYTQTVALLMRFHRYRNSPAAPDRRLDASRDYPEPADRRRIRKCHPRPHTAPRSFSHQ